MDTRDLKHDIMEEYLVRLGKIFAVSYYKWKKFWKLQSSMCCDVILIDTYLYVFKSRKMFRKRAPTCLKCGGFDCWIEVVDVWVLIVFSFQPFCIFEKNLTIRSWKKMWLFLGRVIWEDFFFFFVLYFIEFLIISYHLYTNNEVISKWNIALVTPNI